MRKLILLAVFVLSGCIVTPRDHHHHQPVENHDHHGHHHHY